MFGGVCIEFACGRVNFGRRGVAYDIATAVAFNIDDVVWPIRADHHVRSPLWVGMANRNSAIASHFRSWNF